MLRRLLLAPLLLASTAAAQTFDGFELVADFNTSGQVPHSGDPLEIAGGELIGSIALFSTRKVGIEAYPYPWKPQLYAIELGKPATLLSGDFAPIWGYNLAVLHGGKLYFQASDALVGTEIWVSDGTPAGTHVWDDVVPGPASFGPRPKLAVPGGFVYTALVQPDVYDLVFTNGTPGVEIKLTDMPVGAIPPIDMTDFHLASSGLLYFAADSGNLGIEVWVSDGTPNGTHLLRDIATGYEDVDVRAFHDYGGLTYFTLLNWATKRQELWSTDGTPVGTQLVMDVGGQFGDHGELVEFAGKLLVSAATAATGGELWALDGTPAAPQLWTDVNPTNAPDAPVELTVLNGQLLFTVTSKYLSSVDHELWVPGPAPMSEQVLNLHPSGSSSPRDLTPHAGRVYFSAEDQTHGRELWSTDGTAAGTFMEGDLQPGLGSSYPNGLVGLPGGLLFRANTAPTGSELFQLVNGVISLHSDLDPGFVNNDFQPREMQAVFARDLAFGANSGSGTNTEPHMLLSDDSMVSLGDLAPGGLPSDPRDFTGVVQNGQKRVFFSANITPATREVFVTDSTAAGTHAVGVQGGIPGSDPVLFTALRDELFYVSEAPLGGRELWRTDGTLTGTHQVSQPSPLGERNPADLVAVGAWIYFSAIDDAGFRNVFRTDGASVTQLSFQASDAANGVEQLENVRGRLVFVQREPGGARFVVHDPVTLGESSYAQGAGFQIGTNQATDPRYAPTVRGSRYFVFAYDDAQGWGYRSLDIDTGAVVVHGATNSALPLQPVDGHSLTFIGAQGYFTGNGPKGIELYRLSGAPLSTALVYNAYGAPSGLEKSGNPRALVAAGDDLYFVQGNLPAYFDNQNDILTTSGGLVTSASEVDAVSVNVPSELVLANGALYFAVDFFEAIGDELCRRTELGAHVVDFGTHASGGFLEVDSPILGTSVGVYLRNQAPGTVATLWFSAVTSGPTAGLAIPGDALWLDPTTAHLNAITTNVELLKSIPIPAVAQLVHKQFVVQGVMVEPLVGSLRTTNAKLVTLGY